MLGAGDQERPDVDRSTTTVSISIIDLNDETPRFSTNQVSASVREGLPVGVIVNLNETVEVADPDQV